LQRARPKTKAFNREEREGIAKSVKKDICKLHAFQME
jgi:hypothetical protein